MINMRRIIILPISAIILAAPLSAFSPPSSSGSIISRHCQQSDAAGIVTTKKKKDINLLQHRRRHRRDLHIITTSLALDSNSGNSNNNVVDDLWTTGSSDIEIEMSDLNLSSNNNNNDEDDDVKKGSTHEIVLLTNGSNNQEIISSLDTTTTTTTNNSLKENDDNSDITTKYIFLGGTIVILIVAGVLAVNMGNDLGIDLELGYVMLFTLLFCSDVNCNIALYLNIADRCPSHTIYIYIILYAFSLHIMTKKQIDTKKHEHKKINNTKTTNKRPIQFIRYHPFLPRNHGHYQGHAILQFVLYISRNIGHTGRTYHDGKFGFLIWDSVGYNHLSFLSECGG